MNGKLAVDILGWAGAALVLLAYFAVSTHRLSPASIMFQLLNLLGAIGLTVNALYYGAYPSIGVNLVWAGIALSACIGIYRSRTGNESVNTLTNKTTGETRSEKGSAKDG
ncbi:MAG: CBU_0592 family membrane protein [Anaerolineales bacterium]|jgi:hypothetical protein